jgi:hypothetical protein
VLTVVAFDRGKFSDYLRISWPETIRILPWAVWICALRVCVPLGVMAPTTGFSLHESGAVQQQRMRRLRTSKGASSLLTSEYYVPRNYPLQLFGVSLPTREGTARMMTD